RRPDAHECGAHGRLYPCAARTIGEKRSSRQFLPCNGDGVNLWLAPGLDRRDPNQRSRYGWIGSVPSRIKENTNHYHHATPGVVMEIALISSSPNRRRCPAVAVSHFVGAGERT